MRRDHCTAVLWSLIHVVVTELRFVVVRCSVIAGLCAAEPLSLLTFAVVAVLCFGLVSVLRCAVVYVLYYSW